MCLIVDLLIVLVRLREPPAVQLHRVTGSSVCRVKESTSVSLGQTVRLICIAQASVPDMTLHYQWFQNKLSIPHAVNSTVDIESVQDFHDGHYHCIVSDRPVDPDSLPNSSVSSSLAEITIASPGTVHAFNFHC